MVIIRESLETYCPAERMVVFTPPLAEWRQFLSPVVYSVGLSRRVFWPFRTLNLVQQMLMAKKQGAVSSCLSPMGGKSPFFLLVYVRMNYHASIGPFGLLRDLSHDLPLFVPLVYSMLCKVDSKRQYSVLEIRSFKFWFCPLLGKNYSTYLGPSLLSKVGNSEVWGEKELNEKSQLSS